MARASSTPRRMGYGVMSAAALQCRDRIRYREEEGVTEFHVVNCIIKTTAEDRDNSRKQHSRLAVDAEDGPVPPEPVVTTAEGHRADTHLPQSSGTHDARLAGDVPAADSIRGKEEGGGAVK